ncbi:MAG: hypothetical protein F7C35_03775 [Desulfurococcales archaeon]|nr:hypothetical protein [Desulfurococcales archaeon]
MGCNNLSEDDVVKEIRERVIAWERSNWAPYPWRVNRTPYKVLIAELLLKRTTRQAVAREYPKFIERFPDFNAIYNATLEEVVEAFRHLGLYKQRAVQLKRIAKIIIEKYNGEVPDKWEELVSLPGIGVYLAGAVLSFGFGKKAPVLDSNVIRLLSRLTGIKTKRNQDYLRLLWKLVPDKDHDLFNYGMIDLGALVCHYKKPRCESCPLKDLCVYYSNKSIKNNKNRDCLINIYKKLIKE